MSEPIAVLLIEDSDADAELVKRTLLAEGGAADIERVTSTDELARVLPHRAWDIVLSDYSMPGFDVNKALDLVHAEQPDVPFVVVSGTIGEERAFELIRRGVVDYCLKDNLSRLNSIVDRALREADEHRALKSAEQQLLMAAIEWNTTFDSLSDLVLVLSADGIVLRLNRAALVASGMTPEEALGADVAEVVVRLLGEERREEVWSQRNNGNLQFEIGPCGAEQRWYDVRIDRMLVDDGEMGGWVFVATDITARKAAEVELHDLVEQLERTMNGSVSIASHMVEKRDPYTAGHQEGVATIAVEIAKRLGMPEAQVEVVRVASLLHDIGKIAVPAEILVKPGRLDRYEWMIIQRHPQVGAEVLEDAELGGPIADIIRQHHERLDGTGYPAGLSGDDICLESRVIAVADVTEAMLAHRPYRPALTLAETCAELASGRGRIYDERVVDACLSLLTNGD